MHMNAQRCADINVYYRFSWYQNGEGKSWKNARKSGAAAPPHATRA